MRRITVFVAHARVDLDAARALKIALEEAFAGRLEVFVSLDGPTGPQDERWLEVIRAKLSTASLVVVLASPTSTLRPWVNFEIGAAWVRHMRVVVLPIGDAQAKPTGHPADEFEWFDAAQLVALLRTILGEAMPGAPGGGGGALDERLARAVRAAVRDRS